MFSPTEPATRGRAYNCLSGYNVKEYLIGFNCFIRKDKLIFSVWSRDDKNLLTPTWLLCAQTSSDAPML
jgi:hypothetical protein